MCWLLLLLLLQVDIYFIFFEKHLTIIIIIVETREISKFLNIVRIGDNYLFKTTGRPIVKLLIIFTLNKNLSL